MLLHHRLLPRLLLSPSTPVTTTLLVHCTSLFPTRRILSPCSSALSQVAAAPETVDHSDGDEPQGEVQVQLPLDRLFVPPGASVSAGDAEAATARVLKGSNIVLGPYARGDANVIAADFVKSSVRPDDCPRDGLPEFALVGRSNVGKSSLLNSLVRRKRLALTSKKPGKTQCINHFKVNDSWYLVDLPGYGYAAAPQEARMNWDEFTRNYFLSRENLVSVFLLVDASIPAKKIDLDYASWLGQNKERMQTLIDASAIQHLCNQAFTN
uniref:EngB-type G domain-containing protein n=1 Tax=Oryza meridionalis TaxID=40149 RepID=A0A0E0C7G5_9ORYZ